MNKYPLTLNAVKNNDRSQWDIGDALIEECGPPTGVSSVRDGSYGRLAEAAQYLYEAGYNYDPRVLGYLRQTAYDFRRSERSPGVAWGAHRVAQTPEFLKAVIAGAPKGTRITQDYVEGIRSQLIEQQRREREEAEAKAREEREKAEAEARKAKGKEAKEQAQARLEKARAQEDEVKMAPKKKVAPPEPDDVPILAIRSQFLADAARSVALARSSVKSIKGRMSELTPKAIAAMTEGALEAANAWTEAARIVRSELVNESGHLSVVGE